LRDFQLALKPLVESWKPSEKLQEYDSVDWHEVLVQLAREFWRKPMLFYSDVPRKEYLENIMIAESIVTDVIYRHMVDESKESDESDLVSSESESKSSAASDDTKSVKVEETILPTIEEPVVPTKAVVDCLPIAITPDKVVAVCKSKIPSSISSCDDEQLITNPVEHTKKILPDIDIPDFDSTQSKSKSKSKNDIDGSTSSKRVDKTSPILTSTKDYLKYYPTYKSTNMYLKRLHKKT